MRLSPTCAHQLACCCTRHTAQVARGRCSSGSCAPSFTTSSCARPSARCRNPSGSNSGCGVCQKLSVVTCSLTKEARAPSAWPPMPSTTTRSAACSATAVLTRSWFSSRPPSRLTSALSTRKNKSMHLLDLGALYITSAANPRSSAALKQAPSVVLPHLGAQRTCTHDREHDRLRAPRDQRKLGHAGVRTAQRQPPLPRGRLPPA